MVVAIPVVVEPGLNIPKLGMEQEVPIRRADIARAWHKSGVKKAHRPKRIVAEPLLHGRAGVDDGGGIQVVLQHKKGFIESSAHRALPPDQCPAVVGMPGVMCLDRAAYPLLDGPPLIVVIVIPGFGGRRSRLHDPAMKRVIFVAGSGTVVEGDGTVPCIPRHGAVGSPRAGFGNGRHVASGIERRSR